MRVCLFTPTFLPMQGGAEFAADRVLRGLAERGHEVFALAENQGRGLPDVPYPVRHYRRPPAQHLWPEVLGLALCKAWRRWRFDVVLAFYGYPTGYAATTVRKRLGCPVVVSARGADLYPNFHALKKPRVVATIRKGYQRADRIISISDYLTQRLHEVARGALPPIDQVPNGIDLAEHDRQLEAARQSVPEAAAQHALHEHPFVLHLARLGAVKRHAVALDALRRAAPAMREKNWRYVIAGQGAEEAALREQTHAAGLDDLVIFAGHCTGPAKYWLLGHAQLLVSTSREEGMPNVFLEAMASGLPTLASDILPHRELLAGRKWGRLFPLDDAGAMAAELSALIETDLAPLRRAAMALREQYSLDRMIAGYEQACAKAGT